MPSIWSCLAILFLALRSSVHGYMIDDDCGDDTQFVQDRVAAAFRLIQNAVTELKKNPLNAQVDTWHDTIFGSRFDPAAEAGQNVEKRFSRLLLVKDKTTVDRTQGGDIDVRFYCTSKRIEKVGKAYRNKDRNINYKEGDVNFPGGRFANCFDVAQPTMMITFAVLTKHSEIQICSWFLFHARGYKFRDLSSIPASLWYATSRIVLPIVARKQYTPIDAFVLMDKTIVHELMHIDQHVPPAKDLTDGPYGLKNARNIADKYRQDASQPNPHKNADSNSLFAVGAWILAKGGGPINRDGTFGAPQSTPKAKL